MKETEKKRFDGDDGRVIANMNVEGMPWYDSISPKIRRKDKEKTLPPMTKEETKKLIADLLVAMIPVVCAFLGGFALVIFLMTKFW